jgi:hypothetical protein
MTTKKKIVAALAAGFLSLGLAACPEDLEEPVNDIEEPVNDVEEPEDDPLDDDDDPLDDDEDDDV